MSILTDNESMAEKLSNAQSRLALATQVEETTIKYL